MCFCLCLETKFEGAFQWGVAVSRVAGLAVKEVLSTDLGFESNNIVVWSHCRSPVGPPTRTDVGEVGHAKGHQVECSKAILFLFV